MAIVTKDELLNYFFRDPKAEAYVKEILDVKVKYCYFTEPFVISTSENEVCNLCLLKGSSKLTRKSKHSDLNKFDMVFLPKNDRITITPTNSRHLENKICIVTSPIRGNVARTLEASFEIRQYSPEKFLPRGELGDTGKMATYREVWTAIKNGYFMSGFTSIPQASLEQGVVTSVNLEKDGVMIKILSHVHPGYPEIYIYCIDDNTESVAVTQYLINAKGQSVCQDLSDGDGIFFDGSLGHINFTKPTYKKLKYCLYMWIIPTYGMVEEVIPITLSI